MLPARDLRALGRIILFNPVTSEIANDALNLTYEFNLHVADAFHLVARTNLGREAVLTDDEHMVEKSIKKPLEKHAIKLVDLKEIP